MKIWDPRLEISDSTLDMADVEVIVPYSKVTNMEILDPRSEMSHVTLDLDNGEVTVTDSIITNLLLYQML